MGNQRVWIVAQVEVAHLDGDPLWLAHRAVAWIRVDTPPALRRVLAALEELDDFVILVTAAAGVAFCHQEYCAGVVRVVDKVELDEPEQWSDLQ